MEAPAILGHYRLLRKLKTGGMVEVYLAEDTKKAHPPLAIKKLRKEYAFDRDFIELLRSEALTLGRLTHPHLLQAYDFVSEGADHYLALELVEGPSLMEVFEAQKNAGKTFPFAAALASTHALCDTLAYLHQQGILHSDLNPRNILINRSGDIKLIDFSAAQAEENQLGDTAGVGRAMLGYMSPEQANSKGIDERSDVFSLGILLYEMLLGEIPFEAESRIEVYFHLMKREIRPEGFPKNFPAALGEILCRCLAKKPEERYPAMADLERDLRTYVDREFPRSSPQDLANYLQALNLFPLEKE